MTGVRLELANPHDYKSPADYVEQHLAPVATELHRITNELLEPGATSAEEWAVDMVPPSRSENFQRLDRPLLRLAKHVVFDGSEYFLISKDVLRSKQLKVQLSATVYVHENGTAVFRLVDSLGDAIENSVISTNSREPETVSVVLPFGEQRGCIHPSRQTYFIEACSPHGIIPVCRRFSLSFIYL